MTHESRRRAKKLAHEAMARGEHSGWFETLYREAAGDAGAIPWADGAPNPHLCAWLDRQPANADPGQSPAEALVVGCGLGDDAAELAQRGWRTTGFDISPTAIDWARQRFRGLPADVAGRLAFETVDLFHPPTAWRGRFALVFESYTLQALPAVVRAEAAAQVASFVAPGGRLLILCRGREDHEDPGSLPWPLTRAELQNLPGLNLENWEEFFDGEDPPQRRFRVSYRRG